MTLIRNVPRIAIVVVLLVVLGVGLAHTVYSGGYCDSYLGMVVCR